MKYTACVRICKRPFSVSVNNWFERHNILNPIFVSCVPRETKIWLARWPCTIAHTFVPPVPPPIVYFFRCIINKWIWLLHVCAVIMYCKSEINKVNEWRFLMYTLKYFLHIYLYSRYDKNERKKPYNAPTPLKGLSHEMNWLWWNVWWVLGLNRGQGNFLIFLGAPMILYCKKCISLG